MPTAPAPDLAGHATHDRVLVAAYAAGDATGTGLETAVALVAACTACAALHHDLRLIASALPGVPAPRRTRDFRLTEQQAASLRPAGWRRLLAPFAGPRFAFAAPLGSGLAALGIAGILLAGTGLPLGGTTGAGPAEKVTTNGAAAAPAAAAPPSSGDVVMAQDASAAPAAAPAGAPAGALAPAALAPAAVAASAASPSMDPQLMIGAGGQVASGAGPEDTVVMSETAPWILVLLAASLAGLVVGLVLVALRFVGRSAAGMG
jgi:hypothetical protein